MISFDNYLYDLCDIFALKNSMTSITSARCITGTSIEICATYKPIRFFSTSTFEPDLSDCHRELDFFNVYFVKRLLFFLTCKIPHKTIQYQNDKKVNAVIKARSRPCKKNLLKILLK